MTAINLKEMILTETKAAPKSNIISDN